MFGPNLSGTRAKIVQHNPDRVVRDYIAVPKDYIKLHKFITIVADVIFVNNTQSLTTMSRGIKFMRVEHIQTRTA